MNEHVILLAVVVAAPSRKEAEEYLHTRPSLAPEGWSGEQTTPVIDSWWVAEDERYDGSDNDSAVFVVPGTQRQSRSVLLREGLAH